MQNKLGTKRQNKLETKRASKIYFRLFGNWWSR